ncbi:hypothetical protein [Sphingomonas baiyangensis]|uniref:Uncharacterized protein n=1 Tax=Sphingomonas baiyangensis TaxID=2572576 RepID=A0A4U1L2I6_9SPHN|nr:hypothetical protein [Sphingomonas baiyangensis]TKD50235.1 hypothetical protein FBR43_05290 [Sphingomonas baiyangensis]
MTEERSTFRHSVGALAIGGGFACLVPLYFVPIPEGNKEALLLAIGIVLGWGGAIINGEWGSSPAGRAAASIGLRAPDAPTGKPDDPIATKEAQP